MLQKYVFTFEKVFAVCHMMGILSAIANPLLYGYFNQVLFLTFEFLRFHSGLILKSIQHPMLRGVYPEVLKNLNFVKPFE